MASFIGGFFTTGLARKAYATGVQLFGYTPIDEIIPDPANQLPPGLRAAVNGALDLLDGSINLIARRVNFDRSDVDGALGTLQGKLREMFAPDSPFTYSDVVGPMLDALGKLKTALEPLSAEFDGAAKKYLADVTSTRPAGLADAQQRAKEWTDALASRLGQLDVAGRNVAVAAAVVIEHEAVALDEPVDVMWASVHLADTTERIHDRVGDLPDALKLRTSDTDLLAYFDLASDGLPKVALTPDTDDVLAQFAKDAASIQDPDAAHNDPASFVAACGRLDELLYRLDAGITEALDQELPANPDDVAPSETAIATSMVLCEGVRAVLDMKRGGPQTSRDDDEQRLGSAYDAVVKSAYQDRDGLVRMTDTQLRKAADAEPDPDHDGEGPG